MAETWVHYFQPELKEQSKQWKHRGSPAPKRARPVISAGKVIASIFWGDSEGVLLVDYLTKGQSITEPYYANLLRQLREKLKENQRGKQSLLVHFHRDKMKKELSGQHFATDNDVMVAVEVYLEDQDSSYYEEGSVSSTNVEKVWKLARDHIEK
ncbi:hypothetical protein O3P69_019210 [Scylla paramamosain]|uniref:Uncharacterized protein n=1 Tax=Scylla paramamosain TaxID=85552 RepID=A0AAW0SWX8_SCYPA